MDIILIPGLWLDGSSWDAVVPGLEQAGHRPHPITLPGMESKHADRSGIVLRDHVDAVVAMIDAVDPVDAKVVLVGHSAGGAIAHAAVDARPDRVARVVYVGGFPTGDGDAIADGFPARNGEVPLPDWSAFEDEELADLDDELLDWFRERAIPSPEHVTRDPQRLVDERRYGVPITVIATEFTSDMLRGWVEQGLAPVRELGVIRVVEYVDLPTGHWPQFTRPHDLGRVIAASVASVESVDNAMSDVVESTVSDAVVSAEPASNIDGHGRTEPPIAGDETSTILGFLEFERETFAWKCTGLDAAGMQASTAASSMTLGGLLKHMAYVEDLWFSERLHGREPAPPWNSVDWDADHDWDWHSAAADTPQHLQAMWQDAVDRSRSLVAEAVADGGLERPAAWVDDWYDASPSLRWILLHMIREYARHIGHADLLRESVDGLTGE